MRILIDATAAMSGGKVYLNHLLPELVRRAAGHELIVFHNGDLAGLDQLKEAAARVRLHQVAGLAASNEAWLGKAVLKMLWRLIVFPLALRRLQPDVLLSNAGFVPGWKPRRMRVALALHNSMPLRAELIEAERSALRRWRLRLLRRLMGRAVRQSAATIVFSHDTRARVQACFDVLPERLAVVYHGLDWGAAERQLAVDEAALARLGLRQPYLLYVSQFHRYKNLLLLLEAFGQVAARHPELRLALVGDVADAAYWREVEERIAALDLRERVVHVAACERAALLSIYRGALAFVHPSLAETCSFPLLEALALGVPIAAARMSALPEIAGEAAVYFDPYDAGELAAALERLLTVEELRAELSQKAATRAAQFTWAAAAEQTLAVLEAVGGQRQDFQD